jgi:hypothetical protein
LAYDSILGFQWGEVPAGGSVVLSFQALASGQESLAQFGPEAGFNMLFSALDLPAWGTYRWQIALYLEPYGELPCIYRGEFYREPWWARPLLNPFNPSFSPISEAP